MRPEGGVVVFGAQGVTDSTGVRLLVIRLDGEGDSLWSAVYSGPWGGSTHNFGFGGELLPDDSYVMLGYQTPPSQDQIGTFLLRTYPEGINATYLAVITEVIFLIDVSKPVQQHAFDFVGCAFASGCDTFAL
ncbi:MAG: hypothetical protein IPP40_16580 [bacterium]|nr:hypothetical protein [bacterium]